MSFAVSAHTQSKEKKKSRDLALLLQQTESKFFHELLPVALKELEPFNYFVVHDAIYIPQNRKGDIIKGLNRLSLGFFKMKLTFG